MAIFRNVHTAFWSDVKVQEEFTPEDKYFYLYLLTNPATQQIGVYQITKKQMAFELGYSIEAINAFMQRFTDHHKLISYDNDTREIMIKNWGKYNLVRGGKPVEDLIKKELGLVKNVKLLIPIYYQIPQTKIKEIFYDFLISKGFNVTSDGSLTNRRQEEEVKEQEEVKEKEQVQEVKKESASLVHEDEIARAKVIRFFEENGFGTVGSFVSEKINYWIDDLSSELVLESMKIAVLNGKKTFKYFEAILIDWLDKGLKTLEDVKAYQLKYKEEKSKQSNQKYQGRHQREEIVPDWLNQPETSLNDNVSVSDEEQKRFANLQARLKEKYKK